MEAMLLGDMMMHNKQRFHPKEGLPAYLGSIRQNHSNTDHPVDRPLTPKHQELRNQMEKLMSEVTKYAAQKQYITLFISDRQHLLWPYFSLIIWILRILKSDPICSSESPRPRQNPYTSNEASSSRRNNHESSSSTVPEVADLKANRGDLRRLQRLKDELEVAENQLSLRSILKQELLPESSSDAPTTTTTTSPTTSTTTLTDL